MSQKVSRYPSGMGPDRRQFLRAGLAGCAAASTVPAAAREPDAGDAPAKVRPFELDEMGIAELQEGMASGKFTARSLVERYRARIEEIDRQGPAVNGVIELNPDAAGDRRRARQGAEGQGARGPLHGVPVLIKDNIDTADRWRPPPVRWRWWAPSRRRTPSSWTACARPGR